MSNDILNPEFLGQINQLVKDDLLPLVNDIDQKGFYPEAFLHKLGSIGAFGKDNNIDLLAAIETIAEIASTCGSTSFSAWCQIACVWYLQKSGNQQAQRYLPDLISGKVLAGTGMSNAVKHLAGIERINIQARRENGGYIIRGALPWVSNLGPDHLLIVAAHVEDGGYIMFVLPPSSNSFSLRSCPDFAGINGTGTYTVHIKDVFVPDADILAPEDSFAAYIDSIKPGFLLTQVGIALGLIRASLESIKTSNKRLSHVNKYLDYQFDSLESDYSSLRNSALALAGSEPGIILLDALRVRATASELVLQATQSAALHAGAAGYILKSPVQRRLREALFVAIVTPALKHLRKEIHNLEQAA